MKTIFTNFSVFFFSFCLKAFFHFGELQIQNIPCYTFSTNYKIEGMNYEHL